MMLRVCQRPDFDKNVLLVKIAFRVVNFLELRYLAHDAEGVPAPGFHKQTLIICKLGFDKNCYNIASKNRSVK